MHEDSGSYDSDSHESIGSEDSEHDLDQEDTPDMDETEEYHLVVKSFKAYGLSKQTLQHVLGMLTPVQREAYKLETIENRLIEQIKQVLDYMRDVVFKHGKDSYGPKYDCPPLPHKLKTCIKKNEKQMEKIRLQEVDHSNGSDAEDVDSESSDEDSDEENASDEDDAQSSKNLYRRETSLTLNGTIERCSRNVRTVLKRYLGFKESRDPQQLDKEELKFLLQCCPSEKTCALEAVQFQRLFNKVSTGLETSHQMPTRDELKEMIISCRSSEATPAGANITSFTMQDGIRKSARFTNTPVKFKASPVVLKPWQLDGVIYNFQIRRKNLYTWLKFLDRLDIAKNDPDYLATRIAFKGFCNDMMTFVQEQIRERKTRYPAVFAADSDRMTRAQFDAAEEFKEQKVAEQKVAEHERQKKLDSLVQNHKKLFCAKKEKQDVPKNRYPDKKSTQKGSELTISPYRVYIHRIFPARLNYEFGSGFAANPHQELYDVFRTCLEQGGEDQENLKSQAINHFCTARAYEQNYIDCMRKLHPTILDEERRQRFLTTIHGPRITPDHLSVQNSARNTVAVKHALQQVSEFLQAQDGNEMHTRGESSRKKPN